MEDSNATVRDIPSTFKSKVWTHLGFGNMEGTSKLDKDYAICKNCLAKLSGPNRGHYIAIVKSHDFWLLFDDDIVEKIDAQAIEEFYGLTSEISKNSESGYILFYQSRD